MGGVDVTGSRDRDDGRDELCRLLKCLVESDALGDEARGWLKERDIDLRELHRCLCEDGDGRKTDQRGGDPRCRVQPRPADEIGQAPRTV